MDLRAQCKDSYDKNFENMIRIDVGLIKSPTKSRFYRSFGRVQRLIMGDDNIRSVDIKKGGGNVNVQSVKHLYPFE